MKRDILLLIIIGFSKTCKFSPRPTVCAELPLCRVILPFNFWRKKKKKAHIIELNCIKIHTLSRLKDRNGAAAAAPLKGDEHGPINKSKFISRLVQM